MPSPVARPRAAAAALVLRWAGSLVTGTACAALALLVGQVALPGLVAADAGTRLRWALGLGAVWATLRVLEQFTPLGIQLPRRRTEAASSRGVAAAAVRAPAAARPSAASHVGALARSRPRC